MLKRPILILFIIALAFTSNSCSNNGNAVNTSANSSQTTVKANSNSDLVMENKALHDEKFKWINTNKWDKIILSKTYSPNDRVEITDNKFLQTHNDYYFWLFESLKDAEYPTNGFFSDIESYTYEFIKGDKTYKINVVDRGVIQFNTNYYNVSRYIDNLGKAFLPPPKYIKTDSILNKIYESGAVVGELQYKSPVFSSFRIRGFSNEMQRMIDSGDAILLNNTPKNTGEKVERLTFYYYGQKIYMEVYKAYICLQDADKIYWYKTSPQTNILIVLGAG